MFVSSSEFRGEGHTVLLSLDLQDITIRDHLLCSIRTKKKALEKEKTGLTRGDFSEEIILFGIRWFRDHWSVTHSRIQLRRFQFPVSISLMFWEDFVWSASQPFLLSSKEVLGFSRSSFCGWHLFSFSSLFSPFFWFQDIRWSNNRPNPHLNPLVPLLLLFPSLLPVSGFLLRMQS